MEFDETDLSLSSGRNITGSISANRENAAEDHVSKGSVPSDEPDGTAQSYTPEYVPDSGEGETSSVSETESVSESEPKEVVSVATPDAPSENVDNNVKGQLPGTGSDEKDPVKKTRGNWTLVKKLVVPPDEVHNDEVPAEEKHEHDDDDSEGDPEVKKRRVEPEPETIEEQFLTSIEDGNVNIFMDFLYRKDELNLDLNYENANGITPLRMAISEGYSAMVEQLLKQDDVNIGDAMLRAVDVGFEETVEMIANYAATLKTSLARMCVVDCRPDDDSYHPDMTPMVMAAQRNDFTLVKILKNAGCKIKPISTKKKDAATSAAADDLQKSIGSLEVYKGLASEAYMTQANADPVESSFRLSNKLRSLSKKDVEFKLSYLELADSVDLIGTEVISYARDTEEILTVLTHSNDNANSGNLGPLPTISRAISYEQKEFVAHPNCQQAVVTKFYGHFSFLRDMRTLHRMTLLLSMVLGFPFLSLLYLYVPIKWVKKYIGCHYTKFVLKLSSDIYFVVILTADTVLHRGAADEFSLFRPTKVVLLVWIIGIGWREVKCFRQQGFDVFTQVGHWRDIILVMLFLFGVVLDIAAYFAREEEDVVTSESRRDTYLYAAMHDGGSQQIYPADTDMSLTMSNASFPGLTTVLHRVARQARRPTGAGGGDDGSPNVNLTLFTFLNYEWWHPKLVSISFFALSTVIAHLRILPYVVISDTLGPLQISLSSMVTRTAHFFLIVFLVVLAFAVGLTYIYAYYEEIKTLTCVDDGVVCEQTKITNLFWSFVYLFWSVMGFEDQEPLKLDNQAQILEAAGLVLYGLFYIVLVIVLLNALIAVMSEVYNEIEENADTEWKFHSTVMWMSVFLDTEVVPPPFNLLPSSDSIKACIRKHLHRKWKRRNSSYPDVRTLTITKEKKRENEPDHSQYKRVMNRLVERYIKAKTAGEQSVEADIDRSDLLGLRNDLVNLKLELYQKLLDSRDNIDNTTVEGRVISATSVEARKVLHKAEQIHDKVETDLIHTVHGFKSEVDIRQKVDREYVIPRKRTREISIQTNQSIPIHNSAASSRRTSFATLVSSASFKDLLQASGKSPTKVEAEPIQPEPPQTRTETEAIRPAAAKRISFASLFQTLQQKEAAEVATQTSDFSEMRPLVSVDISTQTRPEPVPLTTSATTRPLYVDSYVQTHDVLDFWTELNEDSDDEDPNHTPQLTDTMIQSPAFENKGSQIDVAKKQGQPTRPSTTKNPSLSDSQGSGIFSKLLETAKTRIEDGYQSARHLLSTDSPVATDITADDIVLVQPPSSSSPTPSELWYDRNMTDGDWWKPLDGTFNEDEINQHDKVGQVMNHTEERHEHGNNLRVNGIYAHGESYQ